MSTSVVVVARIGGWLRLWARTVVSTVGVGVAVALATTATAGGMTTIVVVTGILVVVIIVAARATIIIVIVGVAHIGVYRNSVTACKRRARS